MTNILGKSQATAEQMAAYLLSVNKSPKINMPILDFCKLFLTVAEKEGVRGDVLFAQSCKETGNFKFTGTVKPEQNNYAGIGTVDANTQGAYFKDEATGILAQAQHAKGYATTQSLNEPCVDPRYHLLVKYGKVGTAPTVEDLGGKWAVPGYDVKKYKTLKEANLNKDSYGYQIINILNKILKQEVTNMANEKLPIIALDAGHGMGTAGKRCSKSLDPNQTREWYLNDRIMDMVEKDLLTNYECKVLRVGDTTGVKDISLAARVKAANAAGATVYVSGHHNAGIYGKTGGGTIVFWYSSNTERAAQAQRLYNEIVGRTGLVGNRVSKVVKKNYYVLKNTKMPAFLFENGFMDSKTDVPIILTEAHAKQTAAGVVAFLVKEYNLKKKDTSTVVISNCYPAYKGKTTSIAAALTSLGINSTYAFRKKIAAANNIKGYIGTATQNIQMLNLLKAGLLKKAA